MDRKDDNENVIAGERRNTSRSGFLGKFKGYINRDKPRKESVVQENYEEVYETSDIDGDTVDVKRRDIRNPEIEQETSEEKSLSTGQKQLGTSVEADSHTLNAQIGQVKAKFEAENQSLEAKFSQVFGELSERMRQQNIRVERGTKVNLNDCWCSCHSCSKQ